MFIKNLITYRHFINNFYKLDEDEQRELVIAAIKPNKIFFLE